MSKPQYQRTPAMLRRELLFWIPLHALQLLAALSTIAVQMASVMLLTASKIYPLESRPWAWPPSERGAQDLHEAVPAWTRRVASKARPLWIWAWNRSAPPPCHP